MVNANRFAFAGRLIPLGGGVGDTVTGTAAETSLASLLIRGKPGGHTGLLRVLTLWETNNDASGKTGRIKFGGATFFGPASSAMANIVSFRPATVDIIFLSASSQIAMAATATGTTSTGNPVAGTVNAGLDQTLEFTGQLADSADSLKLAYWRVDLIL